VIIEDILYIYHVTILENINYTVTLYNKVHLLTLVNVLTNMN